MPNESIDSATHEHMHLADRISRRQMLARASLAAAATTATATALVGASPASALGVFPASTIQDMIDLLPPEGGVVTIPAGSYVGSRLVVRDGVMLQGQGWNTIIPPFVESFLPRFGISLRDLAVDWTNITVDILAEQYGVDWRYISNGSMLNVKISGGTHGLLVDFSARHNVFTGTFAEATQVGVELYGVDNDGPFGNAFVGGRFTAPICLMLRGSCQANSFFGIIFEGPGPQVIDRQVKVNSDQVIGCFALLPDGSLFQTV